MLSDEKTHAKPRPQPLHCYTAAEQPSEPLPQTLAHTDERTSRPQRFLLTVTLRSPLVSQLLVVQANGTVSPVCAFERLSRRLLFGALERAFERSFSTGKRSQRFLTAGSQQNSCEQPGGRRYKCLEEVFMLDFCQFVSKLKHGAVEWCLCFETV